MSGNAKNVIVTETLCVACEFPNLEVHHQNFPELRVAGTSAEEAATRLAHRLAATLDAVTDPAHREPVEQAIADVQSFLDRKGTPHLARSL